MAKRLDPRRELRFFAFAGGFGLLVLPFLVYLAGLLSLGPYEGGLLRFLGSLYGAFLRLEPTVWLLLLGPWLMLTLLRFTTRPLRRR
ncbi:MAG: hypothetical protein IT483_03685 [Gammaproteobacteria bacterium]|nr:hypothetical protein [Gammaproteobacteria bacterium]